MHSGNNMGVLAGIARRDGKRAPMQTLQEADISIRTGVAMDSRGKPGSRQVTVMALSSWRDACAEVGSDIAWTTRRANLLVDGIALPDTIGATLRIGKVRLLVTGEVDPCSRMDEQCPGLTAALKPAWRGGASCKVIVGGRVGVGDSVILVAPEAAASK